MQIQSFPNSQPGTKDLLLFQLVNNGAYYNTRIDQISSKNEWVTVNSNHTANNYSKIINIGTNVTITLPIVSIGEIEIFNVSSPAFINTQDKPYNNIVYQPANLRAVETSSYFRLIYINDIIGWFPIQGELTVSGVFAGGASLLLEGSLTDTSGNNRTVSLIGDSPEITIGFDDKPTIRFTESSVQELSITSFLSGTSGATLYIVFRPNNDAQYNLIRTSNMDDYWRFSGNSAGYFGTFRSARFEGYPLNMPSSGSHLISIHATNNSYEVIQNNVSKGVRTDNTYSPGDRFRIAADDKRYAGDISLLLVYPYLISSSNQNHTLNISTIKSKFPSLPFTL